jgi:histidine triad (HIT) family protein
MDSNCIFCKIVKGQIPSYKIYEDDNFLAFLDILHFTEGHTLVIPKLHYRFVWDVPNINEYYLFAQKISRHYIDNMKFQYVDSLVFGRDVAHAHIHLIPHNGDHPDWDKILKGFNIFYNDQSRILSVDEGTRISNKFKLK